MRRASEACRRSPADVFAPEDPRFLARPLSAFAATGHRAVLRHAQVTNHRYATFTVRDEPPTRRARWALRARLGLPSLVRAGAG
eukprot:10584879-Alexandrium_andersonii.AAC.1